MRGEPDDDPDVAARAAWLRFAGGVTRSAEAEHSGVPLTRAHRMIARAARDGPVRGFVDWEVAACIALEDRLRAAYRLSTCTVARDLGETRPTLLRALDLAGANLPMRRMDRADGAVIGVGRGSTLATAVDMPPAHDVGGTCFVSLLGGLTRKLAANPFDVIRRLAEKPMPSAVRDNASRRRAGRRGWAPVPRAPHRLRGPSSAGAAHSGRRRHAAGPHRDTPRRQVARPTETARMRGD
jgi:DNA-binding transcriptional regulator LsrR (DeoR family)